MPNDPTRLGNQIEILNPDLVRGRIKHVLFDFDGTLSLIREGWQDVVIPMMVETLADLGTSESEEQLLRTVREFVTRLTGKQTIYQILELNEQIQKRGGKAVEPIEYKHEYLRRLETRIAKRVAGLTAGSTRPDELLLPGSRELLDELRRKGMRLYLASGTDEPFVLREAQLLGVDRYFDGGIYGALDEYQNFSKQMVIDRIIAGHDLNGPELLGIGDGYVEIENTKSARGIALGVASREADPTDFDAWKKDRLATAGADILIPNFNEHRTLLEYLLG